jgi:hypothetical protein
MISLLSCVRKLFERMLLLRLELWVEGSGILSGTQFGFRKGRGNDGLPGSADYRGQNGFSSEKSGPGGGIFGPYRGVYDNVLIDILCRELKKDGVPVPLVFLLWDMMCEEHLYFFDGQDVAFMRTGFKGLPQGSVLSPFMYNFYTRLVEACLHPLCSILQYADTKNICNKNREIFH